MERKEKKEIAECKKKNKQMDFLMSSRLGK